MDIIVDIADDILYKSFYIFGLTELYGKKSVHFSSLPFNRLSKSARNSRSIRFITHKDGLCKKCVINCNDSYEINEELYNWCDVYGNVNANFSKTPDKYHDKLVALCPSFAIRCWNPLGILYDSLRSIGAGDSLRKNMGKHKRLLNRAHYSEYAGEDKANVIDGYVFFLSTLWYSDEWNKNDDGVNLRRANFIRACKELSINFEGGFASQGKDISSELLFRDCLSKGISMRDWMKKTKQSCIVFNTPAFWDCHGWKLGEYLAMGKCVISTKLSNDLPEPLEHGKNIHFVENDKESMKNAIHFIMNNPKYRVRLEEGARAYWEKYGTPTASLRLLGL